MWVPTCGERRIHERAAVSRPGGEVQPHVNGTSPGQTGDEVVNGRVMSITRVSMCNVRTDRAQGG